MVNRSSGSVPRTRIRGAYCVDEQSRQSGADREGQPRVIGHHDVMMHFKGRGYMHSSVDRKDSASPGVLGG